MENNWWAQIQSYSNINDAKNFYEALNGVYGPSRFSLHSISSTDGALIKNKKLILARWAEYQLNLLNKVHSTDLGFLFQKLDDPPPFGEVGKAILSLKDNKTAGPDNIPAEIIKYGGMPNTEGCKISSLTAVPLSVFHSNGKMPTLFLHTSKWVTEHNVTTVVVYPFSQ